VYFKRDKGAVCFEEEIFFLLQVSVLNEQVGAQTEKIKDLESMLDDKLHRLDSTEEMLHEVCCLAHFFSQPAARQPLFRVQFIPKYFSFFIQNILC